MLTQILAGALGAFALLAGPASAQQGSPVCARLEAQLASLDSGGGSPDQRLEAAYNQARAEADRASARARGMGCGRNFLFGPRPPAECRGLQAQVDRLQDNAERLEDQLKRGRGDRGQRDSRRRDVLAALGQHQCGARYEAAAPQGGRGLFGLLFGNRGGLREPVPETGPAQIPQTSTFRTVCVRTCDGFFFPVSYTTVPSRFGQDDNICHRTCPGTEAILFSYPNPGGTIEQATSTTGQPYTSLPNAFKYQTEFVKDCSCKPQGKSWAEALAGAEDDTIGRGDIVVDEERARAMSQPGGTGNLRATPAEAARAAQDSATAATNEGIVEGPANTDPPAGVADAPSTAGAVEPYYVPQAQAPAPQQALPAPTYPQQAPPPQRPRRQREPVYVPPQFR